MATDVDSSGEGPAVPRRWRFATYNTLDWGLQRDGPELQRYEQVAEVIAGLNADVVAIQEIRTGYPPGAGELLDRLAAMAGMTAEVTPARWSEDDAREARHAIAPGAHTFHTGLMWRPGAGIEPDPRSMETWGAGTFFHSLIRLTLVVNGIPIDFASYHAPPFGRQMRADQAERALAALTQPSRPLLVGLDQNCVGAARVPDGPGRSRQYDDDPYVATDWYGDLVYQCDWRYEPDGTRVWWADRRPADIWVSGGLHDVAATLREPWAPTTGHHPDAAGQRGLKRRFDTVFASDDLVPTLRHCEVIDTPLARQASDHLPVVATFEV